MNIVEKINKLKSELDVTVVAHYYQKNEVFNIADIVGDSLELAKKSSEVETRFVLFCGVGFMGQSVKVLAPHKRVIMPKIACCAMARMIDVRYFDENLEILHKAGIKDDDIYPITYINSSAEVKAKVGQMGGIVCTSSNAFAIIKDGLTKGKKIFFVPDRCLGQNFAHGMGLKSAVVGIDDIEDVKSADIICYNGFCSVHQLFTTADIEFYRAKYPGILVAVHPECDPSVARKADFCGSTSQLIKYITQLNIDQKVVVGTEYNMVTRLRDKNTYTLSATKPQCPTMNETTLTDVYDSLLSIKQDNITNEIIIDDNTARYAKIALEKMLHV